MKKEFTIDQMIALEGADYYYDFHNDYELVGLNQENSCVELSFNKIKREWVKESDPNKIRLIFNNVRYFQTSKDFSSNFPKKMEDIGYKSSEDFNYNFLIPEEQANEKSHILFMFEGNEYVRVFSDEIQVRIS